MLNIITTGSTVKKLDLIVNLYKGVLSKYKLNKTSTLILPTPISLYDNYNNVNTVKTLLPTKSIYLYKFLVTSLIVVWGRIIFRGKGFRIRNFQKDLKLTFNFGHSHWTRIKFYKKWFFWKIKRQSYVVLTYNLKYWENFKLFFPSIRVINRYTKRGLRLKRQPIIRRFGKISQYVSSLH